MVSLDHKEVEATKVDLWDSFDRSTGHHFNLSIDLLLGCGACVIVVMLKITFLLLVKKKLEEVVICTGCVLTGTILQSTFERITKEKKILLVYLVHCHLMNGKAG
jgi:hypothetical protein